MTDHEDLKANYKRNRPHPKFNLERFRAACVFRKLVKDGEICFRKVHALLSQYMLDHGVPPVEPRTVKRILDGDTDPLRGSAGREPAIIYLAPALGFTLDWMTSSGRRRRS